MKVFSYIELSYPNYFHNSNLSEVLQLCSGVGVLRKSAWVRMAWGGGGGHRMTNNEETETEKTKYQNHISDVVYIVPDFEVLHLLFNNLLITTPDPPSSSRLWGGGM